MSHIGCSRNARSRPHAPLGIHPGRRPNGTAFRMPLGGTAHPKVGFVFSTGALPREWWEFEVGGAEEHPGDWLRHVVEVTEDKAHLQEP